MDLPKKIESHSDYRQFLDLDLRAHGLQKWRPQYRLIRPQLHYQRLLRLVEYTQSLSGPIGRLRYVLARVRLARASVRTGLSIPPGVFGPGLSIAHYGSIVVNDRSRVGAYCRIHSATNIGASGHEPSTGSPGGVPDIGDFVYIAPGAVLFGDIKVGSRAIVGANSVVFSDVPAGHTAVGSPARMVPGDSYRQMPDSIRQVMASHPEGTEPDV